MKKNFFFFGIFMLFVIASVAIPAKACEFCNLPLPLKQGCLEVAQDAIGSHSLDCQKQFLRELVTGFKRASATIFLKGNTFDWLVDNEGFVRQALQSNISLSGKVYPTNICGRNIIFFYPADNSFLFGLKIKSPSASNSKKTHALISTISVSDSNTGIIGLSKKEEYERYRWDGREIEIQPILSENKKDKKGEER